MLASGRQHKVTLDVLNQDYADPDFRKRWGTDLAGKYFLVPRKATKIGPQCSVEYSPAAVFSADIIVPVKMEVE